MSEMMPLSLRKNFSWTLAGNSVYAVCQWVLLMLLAKIGSAYLLGLFSFGLAVTAPVFMFANFQLREILVTDANGNYEFNQYLGLRIWTALFAILVCGIFAASAYRSEKFFVIVLVAFLKGIEAISDILFGLLQKKERLDKISISMMLKGVISVFVLGAILVLTQNIIWGIVGMLLTWVIVLLMYDLPYVNRYVDIKPVFSIYKGLPLLRLGTPLALTTMMLSLNYNIPRYLIEINYGTEMLGYFTAIVCITYSGSLIIRALGQSTSYRLAKFYAENKIHQFNTLIIKLVIIAAIVGTTGYLIVLIFGRNILELLYESEYSSYVDVFLLIMISAGFDNISAFIGYGFTAVQKFKLQLIICVIVSVTNVIASAVLIPRYSLWGAAYALIVTSFVCLICYLSAYVFWLHIQYRKRAEIGRMGK